MTPAQALAVVVPLESHLEIEAMISNRDIAASPLQAGGPAREITPALHKEPESHIRLGTISGIGNAVRPLRSKYFRLWRSAPITEHRIDAAQRVWSSLRHEEDRPFSIQEHAMRKVLRGYAKDKNGNLILIGTTPVLFSNDKCSPATRQGKRHLVRQGATIFKKETIR